MHELSIALSILDLAEEEAERQRGRIAAIHLKLGRFSGVVKEALVSAYEMAREGTSLAKAELIVEEIPLVIRCAACDAEKVLDSAWSLGCPTCGAPSAEIVRGRELEVSALEIES